MAKLLMFDLDGTLLRTDKSISERTLEAIKKCKKCGYIIGISTSRGEQNCLSFLADLNPDVLITSGGALVKKGDEYLYQAVFSEERTNEIIEQARQICGEDCEITVDTVTTHFWNFKQDPKALDASWGDAVWTDYHDFHEEALKICVEIFSEEKARLLQEELLDCDCVRFSDGYWYKFTRQSATKEEAIKMVCENYEIELANVIAFGDDYADIGMLQMAGTGVAMGNAIDEVKEISDVVIASNDEDGIAEYLDSLNVEQGNYMNDTNELLQQIDRLHTTELGVTRIQRNLSLDTIDVVTWCKEKILSPQASISRNGKNWYVQVDGCIITVNAYSYTIITAHKKCISKCNCSEQGEAFTAEPVLNAVETRNGQFGMRSIAHSKVSVKGTEQIHQNDVDKCKYT